MKGGEKMDPKEFQEFFARQTLPVQYLFVVTEPYQEDERPVGAIFLTGNGKAFETHAEWMPWASRRDILTAALKFITVKRNEMTLLFPIPKKDRKFLAHIAKYGVLRRVGTIQNFYEGSDAVLYQAKRSL